MVITQITGGKAEEEVAAIEQPVARIGRTMSRKTQLASSARSSTLPVVAILCHVTRGTTAVADFMVVSSETKRHMVNIPMMTSIKPSWSQASSCIIVLIMCSVL